MKFSKRESGGVMPVGEGLYAHIEVEFVRGAKFLSLPVGARMLYLAIWCYALGQKREIIERPTDHYLATIAGLSRHPIATYLQRLHDLGLLSFDACHIHVVGLRKKHSKIKFKEEFEIFRDHIENFYGSPFPFPSFPFLSAPYPPKGGSADVAKKPPRPAPMQSAPKVPEEAAGEDTGAAPTARTKPEREWSPMALELLAVLESLEKFTAWDWRGKHADFLESEIRLNPYLDLGREAQKAHAWLIANPKRAKKDYRRFLHGWFERADQWRAKNEPSAFVKPNGPSSSDAQRIHPTVREFAAIAARNWSAFCAMRTPGIGKSREAVVRLFGADALYEPALAFAQKGGFNTCANSQPSFLERDIRAVLADWIPADEREIPREASRSARGDDSSASAVGNGGSASETQEQLTLRESSGGEA